jgi:hypothetical protein
VTLHDDLGDLRAAFDDALRPDGRLITEPDASQLLLHKGRRQVRRRRAFTATGSVAAVASVAAIVTATGLIGNDSHHGAPLPPASGVSPTPTQAVTPTPTVIAGGCVPAPFMLPILDPSTGVTPTDAAKNGSYRNLAPGTSIEVAKTPKGSITLVRGVPNEDFAVSVYSHGPAALVPLGVLGNSANLYPAEVTGAAGPRIPFATSNDRVNNACDRWELQATNVVIPTLVAYGQEIEPIPSPPTVPCTAKSLLPTAGEGATARSYRELLVIFTNQSNTSCIISGYPAISLRDSADNVVPVNLTYGSTNMYRDPGPTKVTVGPGGRASFAVLLDVAGSSKCSTRSSLRVTLPGQKNSIPEPVDVPSCQVSRITVTALVAGGMGARG